MSSWTEPSTSFSGATVTGPTGAAGTYGPVSNGSTVNHERVLNSHAVQIVSTNPGTFVTGHAGLEGSLDDVNFYPLIGSQQVTDGTVLLVVQNEPAQFVRATFAAYSPSSTAGVATVTALVVGQ